MNYLEVDGVSRREQRDARTSTGTRVCLAFTFNRFFLPNIMFVLIHPRNKQIV